MPIFPASFSGRFSPLSLVSVTVVEREKDAHHAKNFDRQAENYSSYSPLLNASKTIIGSSVNVDVHTLVVSSSSTIEM